MPYTADQFRVPMREMVALTIKDFMRWSELIKYHDRDARRIIQAKIQSRGGRKYIIPLPSGYTTAGIGPNIKRTSDTRLWGEITFYGHYNVARDIGQEDVTFETTVDQFKDRLETSAGRAFAIRADQRFAKELENMQWMVPFNPGDPGRSMQQVKSKLRRAGIMGKPNLALSDNVMDSLDYYDANAINPTSVTRFSNQFNMVESMQRFGDFTTGDRAGLCLQVAGACQTGCTMWIYGGADAANRKIINAGETISFCGTEGVVTASQTRTGQKMQFRVECDVWTDSQGRAPVRIWPQLRPQHQNVVLGENQWGQQITSDAYANVTASPVDGADVVVSEGLKPNTSYEQSIAWLNEAITLIPATPGKMKGFGFYETMSINVKEAGDITGNLGAVSYAIEGDIEHGPTETHRLDMYLDALAYQRNLGVRLVGPEVGNC